MTSSAVDPDLVLKATAPRSVKSFIARTELTLKSTRLRDCPLIAVSAAAGFGKTSLLTQWRREAQKQGVLVAWLTLDERDTPDRLIRVLRISLLLACGTTPSIESLATLASPGHGVSAATSWLADVSSMAHEFVLLIDDAHFVKTSAATDLLSYLILNAPGNLTIILASRGAVPPGLVALTPHVARLESEDLRFTLEESKQVLQQQLNHPVDPSTAIRLHELSGGWPLGLQLLLSSVKGHPRLDETVDQIIQEKGNIGLYFQQCLEDRLSSEELDFLDCISIVDVVHPDLAIAVTGRPDAGAVLARLCDLTPLFGQVMSGDWLRMHALALDYLRDRCLKHLSPEKIKELHRLASRWFAAHSILEPAARHALAGGQESMAYELAEQCLPGILAQGDVGRALDWFDLIPKIEAQRRVPIAITGAWALSYFAERRDEAKDVLKFVLENHDLPLSDRAQAAASLIQLVNNEDDFVQERSLCDEWQPYFGKGHQALDDILTSLTAIRSIFQGEPAMARYHLQRALAFKESSAFYISHVSLVNILALAHIWEGRVELAAKIFRPYAERARALLGRRSTASAIWDICLACTHWQMDDRQIATDLLADRFVVLESLQHFRIVTYAFLVFARMSLANSDDASALSKLEQLDAMGAVRKMPSMRVESLAEQVAIHARLARPRKAAMQLERLEAVRCSAEALSRQIYQPLFNVRLLIARAYVEIANQQYQAAKLNLSQAIIGAERLNAAPLSIQSKLLFALALRRTGEDDETVLDEAVSLVNSFGLKRIVRETHPEVFAMVEARQPPRPFSEPSVTKGEREDMPNPMPHEEGAVRLVSNGLLTPKELEILAHLAAGDSNKRIAVALDVGAETVKWHVKNLFMKLNGVDRRHVVERARYLGILH